MSSEQPESSTGPGVQASRLGGEAGGSGPSGGSDVARAAGRGFIFITAAKLWFMVMGAIVNIGLPILMSPETFGIYSIVVNAVSLVNMVIITGTTQAVAKLVSETPEAAGRIVGRAALLQCFVGVPLTLLYVLGAPWIAEGFNDPELSSLIAVSGGVMLAYAFYAIFVGYLNGMKAFGRQASLDASFSTLKTVGIMVAVTMGLGVLGAVSAFVGSAVLVVFIGGAVAWDHHRKERAASLTAAAGAESVSTGKLLGYLVLVMLFTFGVNGVLRVDLFLLKSLVEGAEGLAVDADRLSGVYAAMLNVSRLPYQAVIAVTFVVFPMISKATFDNDHGATQTYIQTTLRYSLLMLALLGVLLAGAAREIILTLYGPDYAIGQWPLVLLSLATIAFALFYIATSMMTGAGHPVASVVVAAITLGVTALLNVAALRFTLGRPGVDEGDLLLAASSATAVSMVVGLGVTIVYLVRRHDAGLPLGTLVRTLVASTSVLAPSVLLTFPELAGRVPNLLVACGKGVVGVVVFFGVLVVLKELGRPDLERVLHVVRRKRAA